MEITFFWDVTPSDLANISQERNCSFCPKDWNSNSSKRLVNIRIPHIRHITEYSRLHTNRHKNLKHQETLQPSPGPFWKISGRRLKIGEVHLIPIFQSEDIHRHFAISQPIHYRYFLKCTERPPKKCILTAVVMYTLVRRAQCIQALNTWTLFLVQYMSHSSPSVCIKFWLQINYLSRFFYTLKCVYVSWTLLYLEPE
jgi:hypothetical protein